MNKIKKALRIMGITLLALIMFAILGSAVYNHIGNSKVKGHIEGLGTTIALVTGGTDSYSQSFIKLVLVRDGSFSFNADLNESGGGRIITWGMLFKRQSGKPLWMRSRIVSFYLNPGEQITVEGILKPFSVDYTIKGNQLSEQNNLFRNLNLPLLEEEAKAALLLDSIRFENASLEKEKLSNLALDSLRAIYNNRKLEYALANPNFELSASFLQIQEKDTIIKYYPTLANHVKQTAEGKLLQKRIEAWSQLQIGRQAPLFTSTAMDGTDFRLAGLRGKYVVLDFWGTWCGPCISGFPKMKEYHSKYKERVAFVGIACRDKETAWRETVAKYELPWIQLLNSKQDRLDLIYTVEGYPTKVLIDQNGNLVQLFMGEDDELYQKLDEIFGSRAVAHKTI